MKNQNQHRQIDCGGVRPPEGPFALSPGHMLPTPVVGGELCSRKPQSLWPGKAGQDRGLLRAIHFISQPFGLCKGGRQTCGHLARLEFLKIAKIGQISFLKLFSPICVIFGNDFGNTSLQIVASRNGQNDQSLPERQTTHKMRTFLPKSLR